MFDDTSLIKMVIAGLMERYNWTFDTAMERFYHSDVCFKISNEASGLFTCAPIEILELLKEESLSYSG